MFECALLDKQGLLVTPFQVKKKTNMKGVNSKQRPWRGTFVFCIVYFEKGKERVRGKREKL